MLRVQSVRLGMDFQSNCYVISNDSGEAAAVDIGGNPDEMIKFLDKNNFSLKKILLTHGHYDHFRGVAAVAEKTGAEVYIHQEDAIMMTHSGKSLATYVSSEDFEPVNEYTVIKDGDTIEFSGVPIRVLHTPGHTKGGVCYICEDKIFSGDTLFRRSIGRTDFPGGSYDELIDSLSKLSELIKENDYIVFPGHETATTLSYEIENNPYMR